MAATQHVLVQFNGKRDVVDVWPRAVCPNVWLSLLTGCVALCVRVCVYVWRVTGTRYIYLTVGSPNVS